MINYSEFSDTTNSFVADPVETIEATEEIVEEAVEKEELDGDLREGKVSAPKIYLRSEATKESKDLTVLSKGEELLVDLAKSTDEWYSVCTVTGVEGYVMKALVTIE